MPEIFDEIVVGLGAMGSATVYQLAQRGRSVLGLEQFSPAHDKGSSHGSSRIIRQAYYEDPSYVPIVLRAYELWERLQADTGSDLLCLTGGLMIGPPESEVVSGSIRSTQTYGLPHEILNAGDIRRRFSPFTPQNEEIALYEAKAGFLRPEECIRQHLAQASKNGAQLHFEEPVVSWTAQVSGDGVTVTTQRGTYHARHLILSSGPWAPEILAALNLPIAVYRRIMFWFDPAGGIAPFLPEHFPIYLWEPKGEGSFYGFPASDGPKGGVKVALHTGNEKCTPDSIDRNIRKDDESAMRAAIANRIPSLNGTVVDARTCMYTMTPDEHFIIDAHPDYPQISIATGFSGHGFKFSSVVGEILADLAINGRTDHDISLFSRRRFQTARA